MTIGREPVRSMTAGDQAMKCRMKPNVIAAFTLASICLLPNLTQAQQAATADIPVQATEAVRFVEDLGGKAVAVVAATPSDAFEWRHERLKDLVREGFDLKLMGRFVLGKYWRSADEAQRAEFQGLFARHLVNSYARQLDGYRAETFKVTAVREVGTRDVLVETRIERRTDEPLDTAWRLRGKDGQYKIIDVMVGGISLALTQRQEFASVAKREGLEGLLASMRGDTPESRDPSRLVQQDSVPDASARVRMLISVVGSSGSPWQVSLARH